MSQKNVVAALQSLVGAISFIEKEIGLFYVMPPSSCNIKYKLTDGVYSPIPSSYKNANIIDALRQTDEWKKLVSELEQDDKINAYLMRGNFLGQPINVDSLVQCLLPPISLDRANPKQVTQHARETLKPLYQGYTYISSRHYLALIDIKEEIRLDKDMVLRKLTDDEISRLIKENILWGDKFFGGIIFAPEYDLVVIETRHKVQCSSHEDFLNYEAVARDESHILSALNKYHSGHRFYISFRFELRVHGFAYTPNSCA
jgi:hypothetical protein